MQTDAYPPELGPVAVYVSEAATSGASLLGEHPEARRRKLAALLVEHGKLVRIELDVGLYRARSRQTQIDVTARVVRSGPLLVVVSCNVREYR